MGEILVKENTDKMWCISSLLIDEIQIQRKAPVKVFNEQIYLDKENNWKIVCLMVGNRILSKKANTYSIMIWLSFDTKKYMCRLLSC